MPFVGLGVTAALGGVTIWSGLDTRKNPGPDAVRKACAGKPDSCALYQEGLRKEKRTDILIGSTAGAGAITIVLAIFTKWSGDPQPVAGSIVPTFDVGRAGETTAGFRGVF